MIYLRAEHLAEMRAHGERDYPHECCGLLIGSFKEDYKEVSEVYPISNAREEEAKRNRFLIRPEELMRGERYARERSLDVVGFYHSHPDHPAAPSAYDLEHAWPSYSYIIVSVREGIAGNLFSWEMLTDRSSFAEEQIKERDEL
ncbi:MAG TPA: M67 family metallopeptidase [Pyrinomonadaceae bacterium]|jgi:proteasome lid subunit RPN8/RPN11